MRWTKLLPFCLVLASCATVARQTVTDESALIDRAVAAAGGEAALRRSPVLAWSGDASVHAGDRTIAIEVESVVDPFVRARSVSWIRGQPRPGNERTLEIEGDHGWTVVKGKRSAMRELAAHHERLQYATYGLMRWVTLRDPGVVLRRLPDDASGHHVLHVEHPRAAPADLFFDDKGRLVALDDTVPSPEDGKPIRQHFEFEGTIEGAGIRWPRSMRIFQDGKPYFDLHLAKFEPRAR